MRVYALVGLFAAAVLYGATYQSFRFFDPNAPGGATDALHYIAMAEGSVPSEPEIRHYRWVTPGAARLLRPITLALVGDELATRLAFYIVNFSFSLVAAIALFAMLRTLGFSILISLLGMCAFASSRVIALVTGTPLVDAGYFCFIAVISCLLVANRGTALALLIPLFALGKETILPFLLLPLLTRMRSSRVLWAGYACAGLGLFVKVMAIDRAYASENPGVSTTVLEHVAELPATALRLATIGGLHDLLHGFSLLLPLAVAGAWLNARHHYRRVPLVITATIPIAFGLALLSGNMGRMFFAAFPAVIAYVLITVEHLTAAKSAS